MAASRLSIYNGALDVLGERHVTLTENREPRLKLDEVWDNCFIDRVLQMGQWNFATRMAQRTASTTIEPPFGYTYAFEKGEDFIKTVGIYQDEYLNCALTQYKDEAKVWYADLDVIYIEYVSNDVQWGADLSLWPGDFAEMAEHYMAYKVAPRLTGITIETGELWKGWKDALKVAKGSDAMEQPTRYATRGTWSRARLDRGGGDRGSRSKLIG